MLQRRSPTVRWLFGLIVAIVGALSREPLIIAQADVQPPVVSRLSPAPDASAISAPTSVEATFNEPIQPATIAFVLRNSANAVVAATMSYDALRRTAVLDPTADLVGGETYSATISGARDPAGNLLAAPVVWSFTVATPGFQDPVELSGLVNPTAIQFAPDGRVFVAERSGVIRVFDSLSDTSPAVFADLRTQVHDFGERGLLGMVLDPAFATRPYVYVLYTHDAAIGGTAPRWGSPNSSPDPCPDPTGSGCVVSARLSRLEVSGDLMTGAEQVLVEDWFQQYPGRSIGGLAFGPDGALYASGGDGARSDVIDVGQFANPSPDPLNEGGALRSQDLRSPADPVTLAGTVIRVDPASGLPPARVTSMTAGAPNTDANGVRSYAVTSVFQGSSPTTVRVLQPTNPAPGKPRRLIYVLPVEVGVTSTSSAYSDGLEELRLLDVHNRFNATLIAPSFNIEPWYGDHVSNPDRRLESFIVNDLVPFGDSLAPPGQSPQRWLIGFSKSGNGALTLILRHPHVFSAAAAWDAPAQFTDMSAFPGMGINFGTETNFDRFEIPTLVARSAQGFAQVNRIWISGDQSAWTSHMVELDQQLNQTGVLHSFVQGGFRAHNWFSGWLNGAVIALDANAAAVAPIDLNAQRIVAYGLRRPARFAFRPGTSEIWLGDVGETVDEIDRITSAPDGTLENFGWPCYDGSATTGYSGGGLSLCNELVAQAGAAATPVRSFAHSQPLFIGDLCIAGNASISGLAFVQPGGSYPTLYGGGLFLADRLRNCIWVMLKGPNGLPDPNSFASVITAAASPIDLQAGPGGDLFYADHDGGTVRRIRHSVGNQAPVAVVQAGPSTFGPLPLTVNFSAVGSSDPDGSTLTYSWDLDGDGTFGDSTLVQPSFTYTAAGSRIVQVRVDDGQGLNAVAAVLISPNNTAPTPAIGAPTASVIWSVGGIIGFSGSATDVEDGALPASALTWSLIAHHCPSTCHSHALQDFVGVAAGSFVAPDHEYPTHLELRLTATDGLGVQSSTSVLIQPRTVALTFNTSPSGLQLTVGSTTGTAPFTRTVIVGSSSAISAPSPQAGSQFVSWSDSGPQTHNVIASATPATYTATFTVPLPANLVLGLGLDEGSGTLLSDRSGSGNTGAISGATWTAQGKFGSALSFDGVNDWVTVADANSLDLTTAMTLEAWVYPTASGGGSWRNVLIKERTGGEVFNLYSNADTNAPVVYVVRAAQTGTPFDARGTAALPLNTWTHLAVTFDNTTLRLFVNGTQVGTRAVAGPMVTSTGALRIGGNSLWGEYFQGRIDEVRVYSRALSAAEIQTDMATPLGTPVADTTAPVRSNLLPTGSQPVGTTQATLSVTTNESATCRYSTTAGIAYGAMTAAFATSNGTAHTASVTGLTNGSSYNYYVRCQDGAGNANSSDAAITFSIAADTTAPVRSNLLPTGTLPVGTTQATLSVTTDESATCRYSATAGVAYTAMTSAFATANGTTHTASATGLANGGSYNYYVRCRDSAGNANSNDSTISFGVTAADTTPPVRSNLLPAGTLPVGTTQATLSVMTNETATCRYSPTAGVAYASMTTSFTTANGTSHMAPVTGLVNGGSYNYFVRCQDQSSNPNTNDAAITFAVASPAPADTTPPVVTMTAPAPNATVSGSVTVSANASDNVGVAGVQFLLNGAPLGAEDITAPYSITWSSTSVANGGPYQLSARARDAATNQTTSSAVSVTVNNTSLGMVAAYNFNQGTGTTLEDRTGSGRTGTISGATWTAQGKYGSALTFDGVNDWVTVADANSLDLTTAMTLEAWVYPTASGGGSWRTVLMKERPSGEVYNLYANADTNVPVVYVVRSAQPGQPQDARGTAALPLNTWTHLAVTFDNTTLRLFVNGTQVGTRAVAGPMLTSTGVLRMGGNSLWGEYFQGRIDDVRIYNRALSTAEIQADSTTPIP